MSHTGKKEDQAHRQTSLNTRTVNRLSWIILVSALILCASACGRKKTRVESPASPVSAKSGQETSQPPAMIAETEQSPEKRLDAAKGTSLGPTIRIGLLTDAREIRIAATGDYSIREHRSEASSKSVRGEIRLRMEQEEKTTGKERCYRIQVSSLRSGSAAEELRSALSDQYNVPVIIRENDDATSNRIRVGEFATKAEAQRMLETLKTSGHKDAYIVEDFRPKRSGKPVLALRGDDNLFLLSTSGFLFMPSSDSGFMTVNGRAYRGLLDVRLNKSNRITVVNHVRVEEYLLGVVPAELSPSSYPEFDALAAQSIVARTYALRHMGRYSSEGFDLTDDTRTQVYNGVGAEKEATNEAVRRTAGIAIYYGDELIDAMYMSTCGGRTEDSSNVYGNAHVPYLQSVFCAVDGAPDDAATTVAGSHALQEPLHAEDGSVANRDLEFARILGIIPRDASLSAEYLSGTVSGDEATRLIKMPWRY